MFSPQIEVANVKVATTKNKGHDPEFWVERIMERLISVSEGADPMVKEQAKAFKGSIERLHIKKNIYDIIVVINYNFNPVRKKRGSAIFLHVAKKNYEPTLGCIALSKKDLKNLLLIINKKTFLKIV